MSLLSGCGQAIYSNYPPAPKAGKAVANDLEQIMQTSPSSHYDGLEDFFNRYDTYQQQIKITRDAYGNK